MGKKAGLWEHQKFIGKTGNCGKDRERNGILGSTRDQGSDSGIVGPTRYYRKKGDHGSEMELWETRNYGNGAVSWGRSGIVGDTGIVGKMMACIAGE